MIDDYFRQRCPHCGGRGEVPNDVIGWNVDCSHCDGKEDYDWEHSAAPDFIRSLRNMLESAEALGLEYDSLTLSVPETLFSKIYPGICDSPPTIYFGKNQIVIKKES